MMLGWRGFWILMTTMMCALEIGLTLETMRAGWLGMPGWVARFRNESILKDHRLYIC